MLLVKREHARFLSPDGNKLIRSQDPRPCVPSRFLGVLSNSPPNRRSSWNRFIWPVFLFWNSGTIRRRKEVKHFLFKHRRIHMKFFPSAPELNPANRCGTARTRSVEIWPLNPCLNSATCSTTRVQNLRRSQKLLHSCIYSSDLRWKR
jgi:hypothetical protein